MASSTENLARHMRRKRELLAQMLTVGLRQRELIKEGNITDLLRILSAKQQLIDALVVTERELDAYRHDDPAERSWATPEARAACASNANDCQRLYEQIVSLEKEQEAQLADRRDGIAEQLRAVQSAQLVRQSYEPHHRPNGPHQTAANQTVANQKNSSSTASTPHSHSASANKTSSNIAPLNDAPPLPGSLDLTSGS